MSMNDELYERYKANLETVNGRCVHTARADLAKTIAGLFREDGLKTTCLQNTPLMRETGVAAALEAAGVTVYTDHIRLHAETAQGGIGENQYAIAELGSLLQTNDDVDGRIVGTMSEDYFGIVRGSAIVPTYDDMFDILVALPKMPSFVGFVTGPSRTADIECVTAVGVHGPLRLTAVVIDDE